MDSIFKKVSKSDKRERLQKAVNISVSIIAKGVEDKIYSLLPDYLMENDVLICRPRGNTSLPSADGQFTVNFHLAEFSYFAQAEGLIQGDRIYFDCKDLYQLQRRKSTRVGLPHGYKAIFNVLDHRGQTVFYEATVLDYSSGGMKILVKSPEVKFNVGDPFSGHLKLGHRSPTKLKAEVRYVAPKIDGVDDQILGVQFVKVDLTTEAKLMSFTLDLHRELLVIRDKELRTRRSG